MKIIRAYSLGLAALGHPDLRRLILLTLGLAFGLILLVGAGLIFAVQWVPPFEPAWAYILLTWGGSFGAALLALWLFPVVALAVGGALGDAIAGRIEAAFYPHHAAGRDMPFWLGLGMTLRLALLALVLNGGLFLLFLIPIFSPFAALGFVLLNGYVLAREYFLSMAMRHTDAARALALWQAHKPRLWLAGLPLAVLALLPFLNLSLPFLALAIYINLYKQTDGGASSR